jgi:hypothetical protein
MTEYRTLTGSLIVVPSGQTIYSELATTIRMADEAAGLFVEVEQHGREDIGKISINPEEWPALRDAIDLMFNEIKVAIREQE